MKNKIILFMIIVPINTIHCTEKNSLYHRFMQYSKTFIQEVRILNASLPPVRPQQKRQEEKSGAMVVAGRPIATRVAPAAHASRLCSNQTRLLLINKKPDPASEELVLSFCIGYPCVFLALPFHESIESLKRLSNALTKHEQHQYIEGRDYVVHIEFANSKDLQMLNQINKDDIASYKKDYNNKVSSKTLMQNLEWIKNHAISSDACDEKYGLSIKDDGDNNQIKRKIEHRNLLKQKS